MKLRYQILLSAIAILLPHSYLIFRDLFPLTVHSLKETFYGIFFVLCFFSIGVVPILLGIHYAIKIISKKKLYRWLQITLIPLFGAVIVPSVFFYIAFSTDDRWRGIGGALFGLTNLLAYLFNEIYLLISLKKEKKL